MDQADQEKVAALVLNITQSWPFRWITKGFFLMFAGIALWMFAMGFVLPLIHYIASSGWTQTPCTILSSRMTVNAPEQFSLVIQYQYEAGGKLQTSNRYNIAEFQMTDTDIGSILTQYPAGSQATCLVNPNDPTEAILVRDIEANVGLGIITLIMAGIGIFLFLRKNPFMRVRTISPA